MVAQRLQHGVKALGRHVAAHMAVVHQHHRRVGASTQTFAGLYREHAVVGGLTGRHLQALAHVLHRVLAAAQLARQVGAHTQLVAPHRLLVVHVVEGHHLVHRHDWHAQVVGHIHLGFGRDPALLVLNNRQARHHRRLPTLGRVLCQLPIKAGTHGIVDHRSISPKTMSMVPMIATASANIWPRVSSSSPAKWANPGARILRR